MRIAHLTDVYRPQVGGIEILVDDLARRQAMQGHQVVVLTESPGRADDDATGPEVIRPWSRLSAARHFHDVRRRIAVGEFDVVHAHLSVLSPFTTLAARHATRHGLPLVLTVHSMWNGRQLVVKTAGAIAGWREWPAVWTAVSTAAAAEVRAALPAAADVAVVPNAVESDWWASAARADGRPGVRRPLTFVSVMRMVERKRPLSLVRSLQWARARAPADIPIRAVLVGDGPLASIVADNLRRRGMAHWVSMTGEIPREQVREVYADADVYVAPSDRESFGIAPLEARAAGLPVIAMRSGGVGDFISDGVEGILCDDDPALSRALLLMATQPAIVTSMQAHNRAVRPRVCWDDALLSFAACYERARIMRAVESDEHPGHRGRTRHAGAR